MTIRKTLSIFKKALIAYCIFIFLIQTYHLSTFINGEILIDYCIQITIYFLLIAILLVRKKWMWFVGIFYFAIGNIDLFYCDILTGISRYDFSGYALFDFLSPIYGIGHYFSFFQNNYILNIIYLIFIITTILIFPLAMISFFTNYVRKHYGLLPIFKSK